MFKHVKIMNVFICGEEFNKKAPYYQFKAVSECSSLKSDSHSDLQPSQSATILISYPIQQLSQSAAISVSYHPNQQPPQSAAGVFPQFFHFLIFSHNHIVAFFLFCLRKTLISFSSFFCSPSLLSS